MGSHCGLDELARLLMRNLGACFGSDTSSDTGFKAKCCAAVGTHLRRSLLPAVELQLRSGVAQGQAGGPATPTVMHRKELAGLVFWVERTLGVLLEELKREGDGHGGRGGTLAATMALSAQSNDPFNKIVFACISECLCARLREELLLVETADPVPMAYVTLSTLVPFRCETKRPE